MSDKKRAEILSHTPIKYILQSGEPARIVIAALLQAGYSYVQIKEMMKKQLLASEVDRIVSLYKLKELS